MALLAWLFHMGGFCPAAGTKTPWARKGDNCNTTAGDVLVLGCVLGQ